MSFHDHPNQLRSVSDGFTRPDATPATPGPQGYPYSTPIGTTSRIHSGHLSGAADDWVALTLTDGTTAAGDFDWTYTFVTGSNRFAQNTDIINVYLRYRDPNNRCYLELTSAAANQPAVGAKGLAVYRMIGGIVTKLGEVDQAAYVNPGETHSLQALCVSNSLTVYLDGNPLLTLAFTALQEALGVGVHQRANDGYGVSLVGSAPIEFGFRARARRT